MTELLTRPGAIAYVIEEKNSVVAFAIASLKSKNTQAIAYIETIEVLAAFRSRGFARRLLAQLEDSALAHSAELIWLHVDSKNNAAIRLYEASGYQKIREQENFYPNGNPAFIYRKSLANL
jgi:ribosomal protein S18 acetylase RimI-like enzyme